MTTIIKATNIYNKSKEELFSEADVVSRNDLSNMEDEPSLNEGNDIEQEFLLNMSKQRKSSSDQPISVNSSDNDDNDVLLNSGTDIMSQSSQRMLPQPPSTGKLKHRKIFRTYSDPILSTMHNSKDRIRKLVRKGSNFRSFRRSNTRQDSRQQTSTSDDSLFADSNEVKKYESAKSRGRRGAVVCLEINQSVSMVNYNLQGDRYCQFNFIPAFKGPIVEK